MSATDNVSTVQFSDHLANVQFPQSAVRNAKNAEVKAYTGLTNWYQANRQGSSI
jgi:hypothetical protein